MADAITSKSLKNKPKIFKAQWSTALRKCNSINSTAFKIGQTLIHEWANHETLKCIVKQQTIAVETGVSTKTVQRCVLALERAGFLHVERFNGHSHPCKFFFNIPNDNGSQCQQENRVDRCVPPTHETEWTNVSGRVDTSVHGNQPEPINLSNLYSTDVEKTNLEDFISKYPRRGDIKKIATEYKNTISSGVLHQQLVFAIQAYCRENSDNINNGKMNYLKLPNNWLQERCYDRYPMPTEGNKIKTICGVSILTVQGIRDGKPYMCRDVTPSTAAALIAEKHITVAQCKSVGLAIGL